MSHEQKPPQNHGVILGKKDSDYVGAVLPYVVRLLSGVWDPYTPDPIKRWNIGGDDMLCVTHSDINSLDTQQIQMTGRANWYKKSHRWIAKMSNTKPDGNRLDLVADAVREFGLVPYEMYPDPSEPWDWNEYHKPIPEPLLSQLKAEGQKWKKQWAVAYEWVDITGIWFGNYANIKKQLRHSPLQIVIPGHAILQVQNMDDMMRYMDTYAPYFKNQKQNTITHALKIVLNPLKGQTMSNAILVKKGGEYGFYAPTINPSNLIGDALHFGLEIPKNPDGSVNFAEVDKLVQGEVIPKP